MTPSIKYIECPNCGQQAKQYGNTATCEICEESFQWNAQDKVWELVGFIPPANEEQEEACQEIIEEESTVDIPQKSTVCGAIKNHFEGVLDEWI